MIKKIIFKTLLLMGSLANHCLSMNPNGDKFSYAEKKYLDALQNATKNEENPTQTAAHPPPTQTDQRKTKQRVGSKRPRVNNPRPQVQIGTEQEEQRPPQLKYEVWLAARQAENRAPGQPTVTPVRKKPKLKRFK